MHTGISTECIQHMTLEEENALQYVGGFVIRAAKDKEILYTELSGTGHLLLQPVKLVNRGGLVQIIEDAH